MIKLKSAFRYLLILIPAVSVFYYTGCSDSTTSPEEQTDDQFIENVVRYGFSTNNDDDENLMFNEITDLDDGGPLDIGDTPIDSLDRWGRKILNVNVNINISSVGDTIKNVIVTRAVTGEFHIKGWIGGVFQTIVKPYTEEIKRNVVFKRVARTQYPRLNWRLYKISMTDGETKTPQIGTDYVRMDKLEIFINGTLTYTFLGEDFTQNEFITRRFNGSGIPEAELGDEVKMIVHTFSTESESDIVAWHWARNTFGFHREPFTMTSNTPTQGGYLRTFENTWTIYNQHRLGAHNGFISASTHKSLYDDGLNQFASDLLGLPYRIKP